MEEKDDLNILSINQSINQSVSTSWLCAGLQKTPTWDQEPKLSRISSTKEVFAEAPTKLCTISGVFKRLHKNLFYL